VRPACRVCSFAYEPQAGLAELQLKHVAADGRSCPGDPTSVEDEPCGCGPLAEITLGHLPSLGCGRSPGGRVDSTNRGLDVIRTGTLEE
jgi:hypothetical protein